VVKVRLEGLKIARARGKYYVYVRATGEALLKGFEGDKVALQRRLSMPDMIGAYNARRNRPQPTYPDDTLGGLVRWYITECPKFQKLSEATKKDYNAAFNYLESEFDAPLCSITQPALYEVQDKCANDKWPRFADKMMAALSSMFSQAVKRGRMQINPAKGLDKVHSADPNANREWALEEWNDAVRMAPLEIKTPLMLARHAGFRGQTIASVQWKNYQPDSRFGKCFRHVAKKNDEKSWIPADPELQAYLDALPRTSLHIATREDGTPWRDEKQMQTAVSHFLRSVQAKSAVEAGATLHGLRVSFAAELGRAGTSDADVAAALGDRSERMGKHYTRHVENEGRVIRAFEAKKRKP
jgi:integrase